MPWYLINQMRQEIDEIRGVINKFVDKCYNIKTFNDKTKCANCTNTALFCNLHVKWYASLTIGSVIHEI